MSRRHLLKWFKYVIWVMAHQERKTGRKQYHPFRPEKISIPIFKLTWLQIEIFEQPRPWFMKHKWLCSALPNITAGCNYFTEHYSQLCFHELAQKTTLLKQLWLKNTSWNKHLFQMNILDPNLKKKELIVACSEFMFILQTTYENEAGIIWKKYEEKVSWYQ